MNTIGKGFSTSRYSGYANKAAYMQRRETERAASARSNKTSVADKTESASSTSASSVKLSKKAQSVLDTLQSKYGNMDFFVQDFSGANEAKSIMSGSTREFSVLLTPDELEKMANDESYMKEKMDCIDGAVRMSEQIDREIPLVSSNDNDLIRDDISKIGIAFDNNGKMTLFADLEKSTQYRNEKLDESMKKKAAEKKEDAKNEAKTKTTTVTADSAKKLLSKLMSFDWSEVEDEKENAYSSPSLFDFLA
ncbi:MAG: DUF6033 family protein [Bacteroides sp.]|nr:DUF6033 family protein [Bacteroides sp.]